MTDVTFDQLRAAARKLPHTSEVHNILDSAEVNANDTVYTDKSATQAEWDQIALASIACLFDSGTKPTTLRWFKQRGYRW
jgi:hypothetical protein